MDETLVLRRADGMPYPTGPIEVRLASLPTAAADPSLPGVWWACEDAAYLAAAVERRRGGREPYAARFEVTPGAVTVRLSCVAMCLPAARAIVDWIVAEWPSRLEDGYGAETTVDAAFA